MSSVNNVLHIDEVTNYPLSLEENKGCQEEQKAKIAWWRYEGELNKPRSVGLLEMAFAKNIRDLLCLQGGHMPDGGELASRILVRDEFLRLYISLRQTQKPLQAPVFECYVIEPQDINNFAVTVLENVPEEGQLECCAVVRVLGGPHYITVLFHVVQGCKRAAILDAANDSRSNKVGFYLKECGFDRVFFTTDAIQYDFDSCAIFGVEVALAAYKNSIWEALEEKGSARSIKIYDDKKVQRHYERKEVLWADLPAAFLKNVQSTAYFDRYPKIKDKDYKDTTLYEYVAAHSIENTLLNCLTNNRIENRLTKMREKIFAYVDQLEEPEIQRIIRQNPINQFRNERKFRNSQQ